MEVSESKQGGDDTQVGALLSINNLDYRIPPSLSVAVSRAHTQYPLTQQSVAAGQEMIFVLPSGSQYVDFKNSYIKFEVTVETLAGQVDGDAVVRSWNTGWQQQHLGLAHGSNPAADPGALALFHSMRYQHSSGTVIDEVNEGLGELMYQRCKWSKTRDWKASVGSLFDLDAAQRARVVNGRTHNPGHNFSAVAVDPANGPHFATSGLSHKVVMPLSVFSDVFNQDKLAPSFLVAGSRLHLKLNPAQKAFCSTVPDDSFTFHIHNAFIHLEQYQLTDAISRVLSSISATSGLEYPFEAWHHNSVTSAQSKVSIQVSRSLSRANQVMLLTRTQNDIHNLSKNSIAAKNFSSEDEHHLKFFVQLGGAYIPKQEVHDAREAYHMAQITNRQLHLEEGNDCQYIWDYKYGGAGTQQLSLESSSVLDQSGAALSSQRVLLFNLERPTSHTSLHTLYVSYVRLATIFLDSITVRS